jgi:hypothetical protein
VVAGANSCNGKDIGNRIAFVRGVLHPPLTKAIGFLGADAIRPRRCETPSADVNYSIIPLITHQDAMAGLYFIISELYGFIRNDEI